MGGTTAVHLARGIRILISQLSCSPPIRILKTSPHPGRCGGHPSPQCGEGEYIILFVFLRQSASAANLVGLVQFNRRFADAATPVGLYAVVVVVLRCTHNDPCFLCSVFGHWFFNHSTLQRFNYSPWVPPQQCMLLQLLCQGGYPGGGSAGPIAHIRDLGV
jgi:hypothetical protein